MLLLVTPPEINIFPLLVEKKVSQTKNRTRIHRFSFNSYPFNKDFQELPLLYVTEHEFHMAEF